MKKKKQNFFVSCIVAAGGSGTRMGKNCDKLFMELNGIPVIARTLLALEKSEVIQEIIVSAREDVIFAIRDIAAEFSISKLKAVVKGGATRAGSVKAAIAELSEYCDFVAVHDGARPLVAKQCIEDAVSAGIEFGAAACGVKPKSTLKRQDSGGFIAETVDRSIIYEIQTPQVFEKELFIKAYQAEDAVLHAATDDCALIEHLGAKIKITEGSYRNIKITTPEDIAIAEGLLSDEEW